MWVLKVKVHSWPWPKVIYIWKLKLAFLRNDWAILNQILFCAWPKYQVSLSKDHWSSGFIVLFILQRVRTDPISPLKSLWSWSSLFAKDNNQENSYHSFKCKLVYEILQVFCGRGSYFKYYARFGQQSVHRWTVGNFCWENCSCFAGKLRKFWYFAKMFCYLTIYSIILKYIFSIK